MTTEMWRGALMIIAAYVGLLGFGMFGGLVLGGASRVTRKMVFTQLDYAAQNGYFKLGEHCHGMSADEIAYDMVCYCEDCKNLRPEFIAPYVREWLRGRWLEGYK